jgi:hypothetical protein
MQYSQRELQDISFGLKTIGWQLKFGPADHVRFELSLTARNRAANLQHDRKA